MQGPVVRMTLYFPPTTADEGVLHHLQLALTAWINETPQGRAAWEASCEDFNIGDLDTLQDSHKASLQPFLQSQGILGTLSLVADGGDCFDFDTLLANPEEIDLEEGAVDEENAIPGEVVGYVEGLEHAPLPTCPKCLTRHTGPLVNAMDGEMVHLQCGSCGTTFSAVAEHDVTFGTVIFAE